MDLHPLFRARRLREWVNLGGRARRAGVCLSRRDQEERQLQSRPLTLAL